jgi:hypothetical protein
LLQEPATTAATANSRCYKRQSPVLQGSATADHSAASADRCCYDLWPPLLQMEVVDTSQTYL